MFQTTFNEKTTVRAEILAVVLFSRISRVKPSRKFPLQFMSIYSNDNISKIAKLTTRELPRLAKTAKITVRENNGVYSIHFQSDITLLYTWLFPRWFYFREFREPDLTTFPLQFMSIYNNENIRKIVKLSPHEFPCLVQNCKNICTRKLWHVYSIAKCYELNNFRVDIIICHLQ